MLATKNTTIKDKHCLVSGSGNGAQYTTEKILSLGGKVLTLSDSSGYIFDEKGIDEGKLQFIKQLKNIRRGRIQEYAARYKEAVYSPLDPKLNANPLWNHKADCAFPCATENEINKNDAAHLVKNRVVLLAEGANMPTTPDGIDILTNSGVLYAPGKAANAGGVAVSGLEMSQNSMRIRWQREEVDEKLRMIMKNIHKTCLNAAEAYGAPGNYMKGANIAGFVKVVDAMLDQGLV
jgi:glutamate dehydrogenase (NADP+)